MNEESHQNLPVSVETVLVGGRVIDPESGLDAVRNVGIRRGRIVAVSSEPLTGGVQVDASGMVVCPGFVDLHSHAQTVAGLQLQAMDGVTTALELEIGASPVRRAYTSANEGRPVNVGFSTSWSAARARLFDGVVLQSEVPIVNFQVHAGLPRWRKKYSARELVPLMNEIEAELQSGAIGIGIALGYAPETDTVEYLELAGLAAMYKVPTFTHGRYLSTVGPGHSMASTREVIAASAQTGAHMHFCHVNSTTAHQADFAAQIFDDAIAAGANVSTEGYPYGSGCTAAGASFLALDLLARYGLSSTSIVHVASGRRMENDAEFRALRTERPGDLVIIDFLDESKPAQRKILFSALRSGNVAIASDAMPPVHRNGTLADRLAGPPSFTHPRTAGCYSRVFRWLVREHGILSLTEAVRRCTLLPAQILEGAAPAMRLKGRIQVGCDADITVFDPVRIRDEATYEHTTKPSTGIEHVLVHGQFVVRKSVLLTDSMPGIAVHGHHSAQLSHV